MTDAPKTNAYTIDDVHQTMDLPRPPRVKPLFSKADIDAADHLTPEEKEAASKRLLSSLNKFGRQPTLTVAANDPDGALASGRAMDDLYALADNFGQRRHTRGGSLLNLLNFMVFKHTGDECLFGGLARYTRDRRVPGFKSHHIAMLDYPDSEVWTPDQRLMLRYAKAVLDNTMTDELWDEAVKAWGIKMCMRYISFMGFFWTVSVRNRTLKVPYPMTSDADGFLDPE